MTRTPPFPSPGPTRRPSRQSPLVAEAVLALLALGCGAGGSGGLGGSGGMVQPSSQSSGSSSGTSSASGQASGFTSTSREAASSAGTVSGPSSSTSAESGPPSPAFRTIYDTILVPNCARCHSHTSAEPGRLNLATAETALATLVNVPPYACAAVNNQIGPATGYLRVIPLDPDRSLLMYVNNRINCTSRHAEDMITSEFSAGYNGFNAEQKELIRGWILAGAR